MHNMSLTHTQKLLVMSFRVHIKLMQGPREDTGFLSGINPGVRMAERIYNFCKKYHPKTNVMVSGIRKPAGKALYFVLLPHRITL
jgi:hypothetical protein